MTTPDPLDSGWDDWRRPTSLAECWPLLSLGAAPLLGLALVVFVAVRAST